MQSASYFSTFTPGSGCNAKGAISPYAFLSNDAGGFQAMPRPAFNASALLQVNCLYPVLNGPNELLRRGCSPRCGRHGLALITPLALVMEAPAAAAS
jgi:hypothetical protein